MLFLIPNVGEHNYSLLFALLLSAVVDPRTTHLLGLVVGDLGVNSVASHFFMMGKN